ncbi:unknown [Clostridium sp. CAG:964]|nr:unknown [Clostridium sp. CAG:964]
MEELNVGRLVAEIVLEAETQQAEKDVAKTAENIKANLNDVSNTTATVKITADAEPALNEAKRVQSEMEYFWKTVGPTVQDPESYRKLLEEMYSPSNPIQIPVAIVPETSTIESMKQKITEYLDAIGIEATQLEAIMNNCFGDMSVYNQYENQLNIIAAKLEQQRKIVSSLKAEQEKLLSKNELSDKQVSILEKATQKYEQEIIKLRQLENQFDKTTLAQDKYVDKKVSNYQKSIAEAEKASQKEQLLEQKAAQKADKANATLVITELTSSLRTFNTVVPGAVDNIGTIVRNINLMKKSMSSKADFSLTLATGVTAIIGAVTTLAVNYYNTVEEAKEKERQAAVEASKEYEESTKNLKDFTSKYLEVKTQLDNVTMSYSEVGNAQKELVNIQGQLTESFGSEAKNIDLVNGKIDDQITKLQLLQKEEAKKVIAENYSAYNTAKSELSKDQTFVVGNTYEKADYNRLTSFREQLQKQFKNLKLEDGGFWKITVETKDAYEELNKLFNYVDKLANDDEISQDIANSFKEQISNNMKSIDKSKISEWQQIVDEYDKAVDTVNGKSNDILEQNIEKLQATYDCLSENTTAIESLSSAYEKLQKGEKLDTAALSELCDAYPQLTKYIAETGDLSLANGEKVREAQKKIIQSNLEALVSDKQALVFKKNRTDEEEALLTKSNAAIAIYRAKLEELNNARVSTKVEINLDDFTAATQTLSNAYKTLDSSKQLDANTTLDLIQKYPEFAEALNKGSGSINDQKRAVEELYKAKQKAMLTSLRSDETELESEISTANKKIAKYDELIEKYSNIGSAVIDYKEKQQQLKNHVEKSNDKLAQTKAQINAINKSSLSDFTKQEDSATKSTAKTNEKLQEQLNLINHRKAINNMSYEEEISWLQMLLKNYAKTADERMSLEEKIYTAQQNLIKQQEQSYSDLYNTQLKNIEHIRAMSQMSNEQYLAELQNIYSTYVLTADERMSLEEKIYTQQQENCSELYKQQTDRIEHLKAMDRLSKQQELAWLQTLYSKYVLTAEERISLEEKIYSLKKSIQDEEAQAIKTAMNAELELLEHRKQLNQLSAEDELAWLQRINNKYKMSVEDRRSMEVKLYQTKKAYEEEIQKLQQETLDKAINALSTRRQHLRITYEEEIKQLRKIYNTYKLTAEQQQQVLEQIRSVSSSARSDRSSQFSNMADGVVEALKNQYQEQRDAEEKVINDSIESWQKWEDETTSAIQAQIDALDDLADAESSEKERQEYENKRQATELLLAYEKDDYNRKQYIKELNRLDNEESKRLADEQREAQKKELQAQIDSAKEQSSKQQEILQAELDAIAKNYDKLMSQYSLENSAYKKMLSSSQNEIVAFIASYAPEYELLGQTLGEKLYRGLKNKIQNIDYYFKNLGILWQYYSNTTSKVANEAVDKFWASRQQYQQQLNNISAVPEVNLTVNFNEPVESPVQVARKMEEVTQKLVAQLKQ